MPAESDTGGNQRDAQLEALEARKLVVRRTLEAVANDRNLGVIQGTVLANEAIGRIQWILTALPDARVTIDWQVAEGEWVATSVTYSGTHLGEWAGLPPTGKQVYLHAVYRNRVVDGAIVEHSVVLDLLTALEHAGAQVVLRPQESA